MGLWCTHFKFGCIRYEFAEYLKVVGIATRYLMGCTGIESRCGWDFSQPSRPPLGPTQPPAQRLTSLISKGKETGARFLPVTRIYRRGWRNKRAIPLIALWAFMVSMDVRIRAPWKPAQPLGSWPGYGGPRCLIYRSYTMRYIHSGMLLKLPDLTIA